MDRRDTSEHNGRAWEPVDTETLGRGGREDGGEVVDVNAAFDSLQEEYDIVGRGIIQGEYFVEGGAEADDKVNHAGASSDASDFGGNSLFQAGPSQVLNDHSKFSVQNHAIHGMASLQWMQNDETAVGKTECVELPAKSPIFRTVLLREWITKALESVAGSSNINGAITSSAYLTASLKIAISLAKQISQAGELASEGNFDMLEQLPSSHGYNWVDSVYIRLRVDGDSNNIKSSDVSNSDKLQDLWEERLLQIEPVPFAEPQWRGDINTQVDSFLESFDGNDFEDAPVEDVDEHSINREDPAAVSVASSTESYQLKIDDLNGSWDEVEKVMKSDGLSEAFLEDELTSPTPPASRQNSELASTALNTIQPEPENLDYLNIESSELQRPPGILGHVHDDNFSNDCAKKIYNLALVMYELFSGGETPHSKLYELALSNGAFVSLPTLSLSDKKEECHDSQGARKRHQGSFDPDDEDKICRSAFNHLKLLGIPGQLCQLIYNMLDCIYGDLSGNECYTTMGDVIDDLQLMLDKPSKFLRNNFDSGRQFFSGLQLKQTFMSRESEFATIQSCYRSSVSGPCEVAIIAGESGTGKSFLASRLGRSISAQGGIFVTGKFGMEQAAPFSALASAFDECCDRLIKEKDADWVKVIVHQLQAALGQDAYHLIKVIPKLGHMNILPPNLHFVDSIHDQDSVHALQRLCYLFCQFVEVISMNSSLTLFLDDLQWADNATFLVLNQLLRSQYQPSSRGQKKFFFLSCVRDVEMSNDHPFWKMTRSIKAFGVNSTIVKLNCMSKDTLNEKVSDLLCLSPRLVKSLSDIVYSKTKGNPQFFSQTMLSLNRDNLLHLSLPRQRWVWNEEDIQSRKLPDNAAMCFADGIKNLPFEVQCAIRTLSMFGTVAQFRHIAALEIQLKTKLIEPLKAAVAEGLVSQRQGSFAFTHDRIMEAAYGMINEEDRHLDHSTIGLCLMKLSLETHDDETLFIAANQINRGGASAFRSEVERITVVKCNLTAGKRSIQMSDFLSAAKFFTYAMSFLPDNHWDNHYSLSLELFELACRAALVTRNMESLNCFSNEVAKHARSFGDKLNTYFIVMISLAYASKVSDAFDNGCAILSQLGEDIPSTVSDESLIRQVEYTQSSIKGMSEDDIFNIRLMTDSSKLMAMKFLAKLASISIFVRPGLQPFISLKMVQLTMSHGEPNYSFGLMCMLSELIFALKHLGLSPMSPLGFAYYGALLAKQDIQVGHQLTLLAKRLVDKLESKEIAGEVIGVLCEIDCYVKPLQASNELRTIAETASLAAGDVHMACIIRACNLSVQVWGGNNLPLLKETVSKGIQFMKEHEHTTTLLFMLNIQKTVVTLLGCESEGLSDDELAKSIQENRNPRQTVVLLFHRMYLSYVLGDGALKEKVENFLQMAKSSCFLMFFDSVTQFFIGLSAYKIYRETRDLIWTKRAQKCRRDIKLWNEQGNEWNFEHKQLLLEAEGYYSDGHFEKAEISFQKAIKAARSHKFVHEEALAFELAAKFYLDTGDTESSLAHFKLAHKSYLEWGANLKADRLFLLIEEKFSNVPRWS